MSRAVHPALPWLDEGAPFPDPACAWGAGSDAPGLLAAGATLDATHLQRAYAHGIFPWFSAGQPVLWWSPDPRMVLPVAQFRLHRSLRKTLQSFQRHARCELRIDHDFPAVIHACAHTPRAGQDGTWIVPAIARAYTDLHAQGLAHSVETWVDGRLVGGLYAVALGRAVFGESMFAHATDASKIALAGLVALCRVQGAPLIDCQQATPHLASLGARPIARAAFLAQMGLQQRQPPLAWRFDPVYWNAILPPPAGPAGRPSTA